MPPAGPQTHSHASHLPAFNGATINSVSRPVPLSVDPLLPSDTQWLFTPAELLQAPSILLGLSQTKEREIRSKGVNFILQVGIMLKLPQITLATAAVFLHRFFMRRPMIVPGVNDGSNNSQSAGIANRASSNSPNSAPQNGIPAQLLQLQGMHHYSIAAACLFLATKVAENNRKVKELVTACVKVASKNPNKIVDEQDKEFWRWRDTILQLEDLLLEVLCFDLNVATPYKPLHDYLMYFGKDGDKRLRNAAWAFANDSTLTMMTLCFEPRVVAASALYAAAKHCGVEFKDDDEGRPWWEVLGVTLRDVKRGVNFMAEMYEGRGSRSDGLYATTPEDGDEWGAKTRDSSGTESPSKRKRGVDGNITANANGTANGGHLIEEGEPRAKKVKSDTNGVGADDNVGIGVEASKTNADGQSKRVDAQDDDGDGSEEGELES
ncbi:hypothetical protein MMC25_003937 [Agyrium rufum]|nr:hypothetical protein [Agyrium rufum]